MLFLSIHPEYVRLILSGQKTVELRRRKPRCVPGDWVAVYSTTPERCLRGIAQVKDVRVGSVRDMWLRVREHAGVSRSEYDEYFAGSKQAIGIQLTNPITLLAPISLSELRNEWPDFQPPQGFRYLDEEQIKFIASNLKDCGHVGNRYSGDCACVG